MDGAESDSAEVDGAESDSADADGGQEDSGGADGDEPETAPVDPEVAAAANLPLLEPGETVVDHQVLNVADGSISTLSEKVDGDRPVLLWFFSPH